MQFDEIQVKEAGQQIDSLLIVGIGSSSTRAFLDNLIAYLIPELTNANTFSSYRFMGSSTEQANANLDTVNKAGYKAILFLLPEGNSIVRLRNKKTIVLLPDKLGGGGFQLQSRQMEYKQQFTFELTTPDYQTKLWMAEIHVFCNPAKPEVPQRLSNATVSSLKKNEFLNLE